MNILIISWALAAVSVQPAAKFDLACAGEVQRRAIGEAAPFVPWSGTLKIDLESRTFCQDACERVEEIGRVTPEEIGLGHLETTAHTDMSMIDRRTGYYRRMVTRFEADGQGSSEIYRATCEHRPFSGFPATRF